MRGSEYIASHLASLGTTDVFGIPGGVVLDLLYAFDAQVGIEPHLSYHEQAAGFAACGYAQASGRLGVAYATRGPGFTNLITAIADAYYDSVPVLFVTAHATPYPPKGMRVFNDQEMDTCAMVQNITKFAARIDSSADFCEIFAQACQLALSGRKGPVLLDIAKTVFSAEIEVPATAALNSIAVPNDDLALHVQGFFDEVAMAKRPVVLIGDGIDRRTSGEALRHFAAKSGLPFLSSRFSHDLLADLPNYYGYVGSHGVRAANFILSKADLVIALGNRLNFPPKSASFSELTKRTRFVRYEIDQSEFARPVQNCRNVGLDVNLLVGELADRVVGFGQFDEWLSVCNRLKSELAQIDVNETVLKIRGLLDSAPSDAIVVSDVGNCEMWLSRASTLPGVNHRTIYSKSFGALGCGLGKAIGAYYASHKPVVCIVGDQGLMVNLQELQYIAQHHLPITIALIDNRASGMIRDVENRWFGRLLHVTPGNGFSMPDWGKISAAFGVADFRIIEVPQELSLTPTLEQGDAVQNLSPRIEPGKYATLDLL